MSAGKVTLVTVLGGALITTSTFGAYFQILIPLAQADNVNTSVTVLNTPPQWTINAHEYVASATSTPTNAGAVLYFSGTADDSNLDPYWLIICKTSVTPTPNVSAAPDCDGGAGNQWAVSSQTASGVEATAATTTTETGQFVNESNDWYGFVCDGNITLPKCNPLATNYDATDSPHSGVGTGHPDSASPFVINHPPAFLTYLNDSPKDPGQSVTWTTTATDTDRIRGGDTLTLHVCRQASFATSSGCTGTGAWATSTGVLASGATPTIDVATSAPITIPYRDGVYSAFLYLMDQGSLAATSTNQGANSSITVSNVAPTIDASLISVGTTTDIYLFRPQSTSGPYTVTFTVTDNNSCRNITDGNEISSATTTIYRSGVTRNLCQTTSDFNTNQCYPSIDSRSYISCTQTGSCLSTSATVTWTCTFELWYNADATDVGSFYAAQDWLAAVQAIDDDFATSTQVEAQTGNDLASFLAFDVTESSIAYGGLQPGDQIDPLSTATSTDLLALGNVGLDENLYGDTMCPNWLNSPDYCDHAWGATGLAAGTSTILASFQKFATSTVSYANATALTSSSSPTLFEIHVLKTTVTSSPETKDTLWAIQVPITITRAGDYSGVNSIIATKSNSLYWQ
jgi:hypothetical protein